MNDALIQGLMTPGAYPHPVEDLRLIETHISWVILTGEYAYKIKKPVDLGFLNFSTLARRRHFCEEELRLNRRTTPDLYLEVVAIAQTDEGLKIGREPAMEYALRMRQFREDARMDHLLEAGRLSARDIRATGRAVARFHADLSPAPGSGGTEVAGYAWRPAYENFEHMSARKADGGFSGGIDAVETWSRAQAGLLQTAFEERRSGGFIRECHGDLHLANLVRLGERIFPFDCLEFNPDLRWIDVINDVAFTAMDLMARGRKDFAFTFLDQYLADTGDYQGLQVLRFYLVYRCMVRLKVALIELESHIEGQAGSPEKEIRLYLDLAMALIGPPRPPCLYLTHGFSGSGKSWLSRRLVGALGALRIRSDVERKRLYGLQAEDRAAAANEAGLYSPQATLRTYDCLAAGCRAGLAGGFSMIADATFLRRSQRRRFIDMAGQTEARVVILDCAAPLDTLRARLQQRAGDQGEASDADIAVLEHQLSHHDPLTVNERLLTIEPDPDLEFLKSLDSH